jgi:hypothetical protein
MGRHISGGWGSPTHTRELVEMTIDKKLVQKEEDTPDLRPLLNFLTQGVSPNPYVQQVTEFRQANQVEESINKLKFEEGTVVEGDTVLRPELTADTGDSDVGSDVRGHRVQGDSTDHHR